MIHIKSHNMEEVKPLTCQQRVINNKKYSKENSKDEELHDDEKPEVRVDMLVKETTKVVPHKFRSRGSARRPEILIVSIALVFIIVFLSFVAVSFFINLPKEKTKPDSIRNSTSKDCNTTSWISSADSLLPETSTTSSNAELKNLNTTLQESATTTLMLSENNITLRDTETSENSTISKYTSSVLKLSKNFILTTEMPAVLENSPFKPTTRSKEIPIADLLSSAITATSRFPASTSVMSVPPTPDGISTSVMNSSFIFDSKDYVNTTKPASVLKTTQYEKTSSRQDSSTPGATVTSAPSKISFTESSIPSLSLSAENKISSTRDEKLIKSADIFFVKGPFTYEEARLACAREGSLLALKNDVRKAWDAGYKRESYGWLRDLHIAMMKAKKNGEVAYEPPQHPDFRQTGAYCVTNPSKLDNDLDVGSNLNKTVNWWLTNDAADVYDLRHVLMSVTSENDDIKYPLLASLKSIYTCCNAFNITYTTGKSPTPYVKKRYPDAIYRKIIEIYHRELAPVKVFTHVTAKYAAMIKYKAATRHRTRIISSLVTMVKDIGLDGIILDYEPRKEYTREHATIYRTFLDELTTAMRKNDLLVGTVVSSWGILKHYDIIGSSKVDFIGSMSSTYYGHNPEKNKKYVLEMLRYIRPDRLEVGLGLMHKNSKVLSSRKTFRWNQTNLRNFMTWSAKEGVQSIHVYPSKWKSHKTTEKYFLEALADFSVS